MSISRRTMWILLVLAVFFSAGTLLLRGTEKKDEPVPERKAYYLTAYDGWEDILAVVVENTTGSLTIVHSSDIWFTDTELPDIEPDQEAARGLFETVSRIRVGDPPEGADAKDPQFGLTEPAAKILVEDTKENGIRFLIGGKTPGGEARYVCADGGKEVYTLPADYDEAFLGSIMQYLDMRLPAGKDLSKMRSISVSDGNSVRFRLEKSGSSSLTGLNYYSLKEPVDLPVAASLFRENISGPLEAMRAVNVLEQTKAPGDAERILSVEDEDGNVYEYRIGTAKDGNVPVYSVSDSRSYQVPEEFVLWTDTDAAGVLGGKLLSVNGGALSVISLEAGENRTDFEITGSGTDLHVKENGAEKSYQIFSSEILDSLNRITIEGIDGSKETEASEEVLRCTILMGKGERKISLAFFETEDRKCLISVNGINAFRCDLSSVQPLVEAAAGME